MWCLDILLDKINNDTRILQHDLQLQQQQLA
jgi:hypothetical protein